MMRDFGAGVAARRKAKGLTQEQLAGLLGVSAPAVSKWETGNALPDVTLLCPLARALGTNVDSLLQFEETLSAEKLQQEIGRVIGLARTEGEEAAHGALQALLQQYPSDVPLKYNAAAVLTMFSMSFPRSPRQADWQARQKALLKQVLEQDQGPYTRAAAHQLAAIAMTEDAPEEVERLLALLPETDIDPTPIRVWLHCRRDQAEQGREVLQRRLYHLALQLLGCLSSLMEEQIEPDPEKALAIGQLCQRLEDLLGVGGGMSRGLLLHQYLRMGQTEQAASCLLDYARCLTGPAQPLPPLLFDTLPPPQPASPELRALLLRGLEEEDTYGPLRAFPAYEQAAALLREGCPH